MHYWVSRIVACAALAVCSPVCAQEQGSDSGTRNRGKVLTGEVAYADPNASGRTSQSDMLSSIEEWAAKLQAILTTSGEGRAPELDQNAVSYLSVLYLFCSAQRGPCPFILETILDADIAAARADNDVKCPLTNRFFKSYISQSLDQRGKFLFSLTRGLEMAKFNSTVRPRFVGCKATITTILADKQVLSDRFGEKGTAAATVAELRAFLSKVREQKVDIFVATGVTH